ncbi:MAG: MFS transporter [Leptolyngbyaceae cyanobacterium MO_188.B28]|nr:MFS transporter [Leptolyngbyaceae cyanobacterium MO_188.B28]
MKPSTHSTRQLTADLADKLKSTTLLHPNYPFQPSRFPLFYGWVILGVTTLGILMSIPGQTAGVSVFTDHLLAATGISRLTLSNAYLVGTLTSGLLLPFGGLLLDRFGARITVLIASTWLAVTLCYLSVSDRIATLIANQFPLVSSSTIAVILLTLGFTSLRFSGQGMLTMASRNTLGKWFDRRRGFVSGLSGVFVSFGFAAAPLLLSYCIGAAGWRGAWFSLALVVGGVMGGIGWIFFRDNPEECGLNMDGTTSISLDKTSSSHNAGQRNFTRGDALKTLAFWASTLALSSQALVYTGITFHIVDIGAAAGLSETQAVSLFLPMAVVSTSVGYLIGMASDRLDLKLLYVLMMTAQVLGFSGMANIGVTEFRAIAILALGVSGGCFGTLATVTLPRYFGRAHLGAISGVQMMSMVIASALGPSLLAVFKDQLGSYKPGLYLCCSFPLIISFLLLMSRNPQEELRC